MTGAKADDISSDGLRLIERPILWRFFEQLSDPKKSLLLDGNWPTLVGIVEDYAKWVCSRASKRRHGFNVNDALEMLRKTAINFGDPGGRGTRRDWNDMARKVNDWSQHSAGHFFAEAESAGLIRWESKRGYWSWCHPLVCKLLKEIGTSTT